MPTRIEWVARPGTTPESWNLLGGCTKKSLGCSNCYAILQSWMKMHHPNPKVRRLYEGTVHKINGKLEWTGRINLASDERLEKPFRWRKPRTVFVCSMSDLFHKDVPNEFIWRVFEIMGCSRKHTFQVLTKRAKRMAEFFRRCKLVPSSNVWGMVTVESQKHVWRIEELLKCPFVVHGVSCGPLLGFVNLRPYFNLDSDAKTGEWTECPGSSLDLVITEGESGKDARPMHPDWARDLRDQCRASGTAFFHKQNGAWLHLSQFSDADLRKYSYDEKLYFRWPDGSLSIRVGKKVAGRLLDGRTWDEFPA